MSKNNFDSVTSIENLVNNLIQKSEDLKTFSEKLKEADQELLKEFEERLWKTNDSMKQSVIDIYTAYSVTREDSQNDIKDTK